MNRRRFTLEQLYALMPAMYRIHERPEDDPLRQLLSVIAEQVSVLEEDIDQLYDDAFIETAAEWAIPYLGDLIGANLVHDTLPDRTFSARAQVANTLAYRRRKGTAAILEQLARDVTNWEARVVEFFRLLATTQHLNHLRTDITSVDLRATETLRWLDTPFDRLAHTADVRLMDGPRGTRPAHNIPNVGLFLWRLRSVPLSNGVQPTQVDAHRYRFDPLGIDRPLWNLPEAERTITGLAQPENVPMPLSRMQLHDHRSSFYGSDLSLEIRTATGVVPPEEVVVCDLSDLPGGGWSHDPAPDRYRVDPELGRFTVPTTGRPDPAGLTVGFHYGTVSEIGGGEYDRQAAILGTADRTLSGGDSGAGANALQAKIDALQSGGALEISDSATYTWGTATAAPALAADAGAQITVRAADGARPLIRLSQSLAISGGPGAAIIFDGVIIAGAALEISGELASVQLHHSTLVPGLGLNPDGTPTAPDAPSLRVDAPDATVTIDHSITGPIRAAVSTEVVVETSIVDAQTPEALAYGGLAPGEPGGPLMIQEGTLRGRVHSELIREANSTLFVARTASPAEPPVLAERRQEGCIRFSYVPSGSQVPRCYRCQPSAAAPDARPAFTALVYSQDAYGQLASSTPDAITRGGENEAEMGVTHDLYQPQRETNLRVQLAEYLRFGLAAEIFYVT